MDLIKFYLLYFLFGLLAWPVSKRLFIRFVDKGWAFSKVIGLLFCSWLTWLLSSFQVLPFGKRSSALIILACFVIIWVYFSKFNFRTFQKEMFKFFKQFYGDCINLYAISSELLFLLCIFILRDLRSHQPDLLNLEKFMDFGFLLSSLKTEYFPPLDHFLSGETINYYYYGHYIAAYLTKLTNVSPTIAFNLVMIFFFASGFSMVFSLGATIASKIGIKRWQVFVAGLLSALLVFVSGNLHYLAYNIVRLFNGFTGANLDFGLIPGADYYYPAATRFIKGTIAEFPIYSFVVNDLHGHYNNIPAVILFVGVLYALMVNVASLSLNTRKFVKLRNDFTHTTALIFVLLFGLMYATNAWDFAIYLPVAGIVFLLMFTYKPSGARLGSVLDGVAIGKSAVLSLGVMFGSILVMWPFWGNLTPFSQGVNLVPLGGQSPIVQLMILWSLHLSFIIIYFCSWRLSSPFCFLLASNTSKASRAALASQIFVSVLFLYSIMLLVAPEFIYMKDIYSEHYRSNTMFKLVYQAWILMGIGIGPAAIYCLNLFKSKRRFFKSYCVLASIVLISGLSYSVIAVKQGCLGYNGRSGLDGFAFMEEFHKEDAKAIKFLNSMFPDQQPTIVEAVGESFTYFSRISAFTAFQSVMGWPVHEWLWRGDYTKPMLPITQYQKRTMRDDSVGSRVRDVELFYNQLRGQDLINFTRDYQVDLVYVGELEHQKYPGLDDKKFDEVFEVIYDSGTVKIYRTQGS